MPDFTQPFNPWEYTPRDGDRVELYSRYYPQGTSVVRVLANGTYELVTDDDSMRDSLENWRRFGIRPAGTPAWHPQEGDHVRLSPGYHPGGLATVTDIDGEHYTLQSRASRPATDFLDSWRQMGLRPVSGSDEPEYFPREGDRVSYRDSSLAVREGTITSVSECGACRRNGEPAWNISIDARSPAHLRAYQERGLVLISRESNGTEGTDTPVPDNSAALQQAVNRHGYAYVPGLGDRVTLDDGLSYTVDAMRLCESCLPDSQDISVRLARDDGEQTTVHLNALLRYGLRPEGAQRRPVPRTWELTEARAYEIIREAMDRDTYGAGAYWWDVVNEASAAARRLSRGDTTDTDSGSARVRLTGERVIRLTYRRSMRFFLDDIANHYDGAGYDRDGYNPLGFNEDGFNREGWDASGFNEDGFDRDGFDRDGFDEDGFDREGYDRDGYDSDGDPRYGSRGRELHSYDYRPELTFYKADDDPHPTTFYGIEIEMTSDCSSAEMRYIRDAGKREALFYAKSDGSVDGFELNVHPVTWAWASENFPWIMVEKLEELGSSVLPESNGIHVHVSRAGFTNATHQFRWMKFFYRNQRNVERIAGRRASSWASFRESHRSTQKAHALNQMKQRGHTARTEEWRTRRYADPAITRPRSPVMEYDETTDNRYSAINTTNSATLEVRVFASTTDPHAFRSRVGLVAATVEYTRQLNARQVIAGGWDWEAFREWVIDNAETYPDLAQDENDQRVLEEAIDREAQEKRERMRLRKEWLKAPAVMTFTEFLAQHESVPVA